MLGISVYFQDYDPEYLTEAAKAGAKYVFTSLQIPEEDYSDLPTKLPRFLKQCRSLGLEVIPDVSPVTFAKMGIAKNDYEELHKRGFKSLRLDYGFEDLELVKKLQEKFMILLNASVITDQYLDEAKKHGVNLNKIKLTYNFYPHTDTGLGWNAFKQRNKWLKDKGLITQAFVPGDRLKRFPLFEGLPTVEKQRGMNPYVAAVQLLHEAHVDDVFIGDSEASIINLRNIWQYQSKNIMHLPCYLNPKNSDLYGQTINVRADQPEKIIRLTLPRVPDIPFNNPVARKTGSIVMQNRLAGRYSGEVYLIKDDLPFEARSNVIGFVSPQYLPLLDQIDSQTKIVFDKL